MFICLSVLFFALHWKIKSLRFKVYFHFTYICNSMVNWIKFYTYSLHPIRCIVGMVVVWFYWQLLVANTDMCPKSNCSINLKLTIKKTSYLLKFSSTNVCWLGCGCCCCCFFFFLWPRINYRFGAYKTKVKPNAYNQIGLRGECNETSIQIYK